MIQRSEPEMLDLELLPVKPLQSLPNKLIQQRKKKISWNYNGWSILGSIPNSAASEAGTRNAESEILTSSAAATVDTTE